MAKKSSIENKIAAKVYSRILLILGVVLLGMSGLAWWANSYTLNMVRDELRAQKIFSKQGKCPYKLKCFMKIFHPKFCAKAGRRT